MMGQFKPSVVAAAYSEYIFVWSDSLKNPELIHFSIAGSLHNILLVFVLLLVNFKVETVEVAFYDVYFACSEDVPSLVVAVVSSV